MTETAGRWWDDAVLAAFLSRQLGGAACVSAASRLSGGAIQDNWALEVAIEGQPPLALVMRSDAATGVQASRSRQQEFQLLQVAHAAGVLVPEPLWPGDASLGRACFFMRRVAGVAAGHRLAKDDRLVPDRAALARDIGRHMARLHRVRPGEPRLDFLPPASPTPAADALAEMGAWLDRHHQPHPALRWAWRWLLRHQPPACTPVLTHRDLRTGNYLVDQGRLSAILDWEFAAWSDPAEDLGWFCAACWRFGQPARDAGGIGPREALLAGYEEEAGWVPSAAAIRYWEIHAHLRWAVIALQQADRVTHGGEASLELALTGQLVPALECQLLADTGIAVPAADDALPDLTLRIAPPLATLIGLARQTLLDDLLPALPASAHYDARMIANVLAISARQHGDASDEQTPAHSPTLQAWLDADDAVSRLVLWRRLEQALMAGELDGDSSHAHAGQDVLARLTWARHREGSGRHYQPV